MMLPLGIVIVAADRRALVRGALSRARLDLHPARSSISENVERFTSGRRRAAAPRPVVLPAGRPRATRSRCRCCCRAPRVAAWRERDRVIETLLWCWIGAIVGFFSLSAGKQDLYIFPIVAGRRGARRPRDRARPADDPSGGRGVSATLARRPARCSRSPAAACCSCSRRPAASTRSTRALIVGVFGLAGGRGGARRVACCGGPAPPRWRCSPR